MPRREFDLPPSDAAFLDLKHPVWETIRSGPVNWLLVCRHPVPEGYTVTTATAALRVEPGYPDTQIDMVYFHPPVVRTDGKTIPNADSTEAIDGRTFQRWSRHRTGENPWRPGVDDVSTHLLLVKHWLEREFAR